MHRSHLPTGFLGLLVLACGFAGAGSTLSADDKKLDLSYVHKDAVAAVIAHPRRVLKKPHLFPSFTMAIPSRKSDTQPALTVLMKGLPVRSIERRWRRRNPLRMRKEVDDERARQAG